jgi:hypothetical protein
MRIAAANVLMESKYRSEKSAAAAESLTMRDNRGILAPKRPAVDTVRISAVAAEARISSADALRAFHENASRRAEKATEAHHEIREEDESRSRLIGASIKGPAGKELSISVLKGNAIKEGGAFAAGSLQPPRIGKDAASGKAAMGADGEQPVFYTTAFVPTADGMHIAVEYSFQLAQAPVAYRRTVIQMMDGQPADPRAIDFDDLATPVTAR